MVAQDSFEIVDLSIPFHVGMPKFDADWFPTFSISEVSPESMSEANWKRRFTVLTLFAHNGTHVETSDHAFADGKTICQYDLKSFVGKPLIMDFSAIPDATEIGVELIERTLSQLSDLHRDSHRILLIRTGYNDRAWGTKTFWRHSPYLSEDAARAVADAGFGLVGLDFQTEKPGERNFVVHKALLSRGVLLCEYLVNLHRVGTDAIFIATPVSIRGVEASPARAIALSFT